MKYFNRLHPVPAFVYLVAVLLVAMLTMDPAVISMCYLSGVLFCGMLIGFRKLMQSLAYSIPLMAVIALTNPLFVHKGETVLFFLNGNPVTREAILYGVFAAMMLLSVFYWSRCYSEIMTGDKFIYLFGRVIPKLSLVLSMALAMIPNMKRRAREIDEAQKALGFYATQSYVDKIRGKMRVLSILLTYCLESSVNTADGMRARGYGLPGRSSYAIYRFSASDWVYLAFTLVLGTASVALILSGAADVSYYPGFSWRHTEPVSYVLYAFLILLTGASVFLEGKENILWRFLRSKI